MLTISRTLSSPTFVRYSGVRCKHRPFSTILLSRIHHYTSICIALIIGGLLVLVSCQVFAQQSDSALPRKSSSQSNLSGYITHSFDYKQNERENDIDASTHLRIKNNFTLNEREVSLVFNGRLRADLDSGDSDRDLALEKQTDVRVFQAYAEVNQLRSPIASFRIGRQWMHEIENVHIDGIRLTTDNQIANYTIFGGRPVSEFSSTKSHFIFGAQARFSGKFNLRLNYLANHGGQQVNKQVGVVLSRRLLNNRVNVYGEYKCLNGKGQELRLSMSAFIPSINTDLSARYFQRSNRNNYAEIADDRIFSDYYRILGSAQKLQQSELTLTRYFNRFALGAGVNKTDINDSDPGNRKSIHSYVSLHVFDVIKEGVNLQLQASRVEQEFSDRYVYNVNGTDGITEIASRDKTRFASGEIEYRPHRDLRVSVGVAFSKFNFLSSLDPNVVLTDSAMSPIGVLTNTPHLLIQDLGGHHIVRTSYVRLRKRLTPDWEVRLRVQYDHGEISNNLESQGYRRMLLRFVRRL